MKVIARFLKWLLKTFLYLGIIAVFVAYICSYAWFKLGYSYAPSFFGYTFVNTNVDIDMMSINTGDLVIAKEYGYKHTAQNGDIVLYISNDTLDVNIVADSFLDEKYNRQYVLKKDIKSEEITVSADDILGEIIMISPGLGDTILYILSPKFVLLAICIYLILHLVISIIITARNNSCKKEAVLQVSSTVEVESSVTENVSNNKDNISDELVSTVINDNTNTNSVAKKTDKKNTTTSNNKKKNKSKNNKNKHNNKTKHKSKKKKKKKRKKGSKKK